MTTSDRLTLGIHLRSQHVEYLTLVARRDEVTISQAFERLLRDRAPGAEIATTRKLPRKAVQHIGIHRDHLAALNTLAARDGLSRSDAARRMIDAAIEAERLDATLGWRD